MLRMKLLLLIFVLIPLDIFPQANDTLPKVELTIEAFKGRKCRLSAKYFVRAANEDRFVVTCFSVGQQPSMPISGKFSSGELTGMYLKNSPGKSGSLVKTDYKLIFGTNIPHNVDTISIEFDIPNLMKIDGSISKHSQLFVDVNPDLDISIYLDNSTNFIYAPVKRIEVIPSKGLKLVSNEGFGASGHSAFSWTASANHNTFQGLLVFEELAIIDLFFYLMLLFIFWLGVVITSVLTGALEDTRKRIVKGILFVIPSLFILIPMFSGVYLIGRTATYHCIAFVIGVFVERFIPDNWKDKITEIKSQVPAG